MDWRALITDSTGELERLLRDDRSARIAAVSGLLALLVTMAIALLLSRRKRRRPSTTTVHRADAGPPASHATRSAAANLGDWGSAPPGPQRADVPAAAAAWPIDRVLPRRLGGTFGLALTIAIGLWLLGLAIAPNIPAFLASREWQFQPLYFAAHIVALRLFILVYAQGFVRGVASLVVPETNVRTLVHRVLGFPGVAIAMLIAVPFAAFDFLYLFSPRYERLGGPTDVAPIDYLMWVVWSIEWFLNAFIWIVLLGFLVKNCWVIYFHRFRAPIEIVLHDRQYRPFLQMSAHGASILLAFTVMTVAYITYTGGEITDYIGLGITATLLVVGFLPPWALLKAKVRRGIEEETLAMRQRLIRNLEQAEIETQSASVHGFPPGHGPGSGGRDVRSLEHRLDAAVSILRISYLENRNQNLGMTEARAVLVRMLAPAASIGWQLSRTHADLIKDLPAYLAKFWG